MKIRQRSNQRIRSELNINDYKEVIPDYLRVWLFRILCDLSGHREFIHGFCFRDDPLAHALGLGEWVNSERAKFDAKRITLQLHDLYRENFDGLNPNMTNNVLSTNINRIANVVGLEETDCRILEFSILLRSEQLLVNATESLGNLSLAKAHDALSVILDISIKDIRTSLASDSVLARTGLLVMNKNGTAELRDRLEILSENFADLAISEMLNPIELLRGQLTPSVAPDLSIEDYGHIQTHLKVLVPYLHHANATARQGVNILIYGQPGTGKSQLVKVLARTVGCDLFEVASEDEDGEPIKGATRLQTYRAAQSFLTNRRALLAFEEFEDIFTDENDLYLGGSSIRPARKVSKAWINRTLEENKVPTFWLTNSIYCLEPAYTRRFDMVIEMPVPPRRQRVKIIAKACKDMVPDDCVHRLADAEQIAPAIIIRAAAVVRCIQDELPGQTAADSIEQMVESTLRAQGHRVQIGRNASQLPAYYDPAFINTEIDLEALANGLAKSKSGRLCLYGPPGTGKTAYGRWLSVKLDMPLTVKRASDLLSPYLGEAEKNMASAFEQATRDGAVLMIDEVDSYLQDRRIAIRSWEVSQVNEFLTQLENYAGIFIASTNLMEGLDPAAMRRFDFKTKFDYLTPEQAWCLFNKQCKAQAITMKDKGLRARFDRLLQLTPGDFAVIARTHRFKPFADAVSVINALVAECEHKEQCHSAIGFM